MEITNRKENVKIMITGGHLTPAAAVIDELKQKGFNNFVWVGRRKTMTFDKNLSAEYRYIKDDLKIPFVNLNTGKIIRFNNIYTFFEFLVNILYILQGFINSFFILIKNKPNIIVSFGGYIAVPIVIAGWILRIPSITHEQTLVAGVANKIISKFAKKVLISWEDTRDYFKGKDVILTGNPIRKEVFEVITDNYKINKKLKTIFIMGGNQGAHVINETTIKILPLLLKNYNVIHQTGLTSVTGDYEKCERLEKSFHGKYKGIYIVKGYIFRSEIGEVFSKSDLFIGRSGANSVSEIIALNKNSVFVPIPWSLNNEQFYNAKLVEKSGLGIIIEENNLSPEMLMKQIKISINKNKVKSKVKIELNAAFKITNEIISLLNFE